MQSTEPANLEACLDATRAALLAGDIQHLARLTSLVDSALADTGPLSASVAQRLKKKADRNAQLLQAALKGVRAAAQRVKDLSSQGRFSTYGAGGQRNQLGLPAVSPARRV